MSNEKLILKLLPEGVKNVGDVIDSQAFKDFVHAESLKPTEPPKPFLSDDGRIIGYGGTGRSFVNEYINTLPDISLEELDSGKANGRYVMAFLED